MLQCNKRCYIGLQIKNALEAETGVTNCYCGLKYLLILCLVSFMEDSVDRAGADKCRGRRGKCRHESVSQELREGSGKELSLYLDFN
jgi:hypothetical protein